MEEYLLEKYKTWSRGTGVIALFQP